MTTIVAAHRGSAEHAVTLFHIGRKPPQFHSAYRITYKKAHHVGEVADKIRARSSLARRLAGRRTLIFLERAAEAAEYPVMMSLLAQGVPIVVSGKAVTPAAWSLKTEASWLGAARVEVAETDKSLRHILQAAIASLLDFRAELVTPPAHEAPPSPAQSEPDRTEWLGALPGVAAATSFLRAESGRLDANRIAELFGIARTDISNLAGGTAEAIRQTPDSARIQPVLMQLERIARLLVLNPDPANFRAWLNTVNSEIGGITPLDAIKQGRAEMVADMVEDILTNRGG